MGKFVVRTIANVIVLIGFFLLGRVLYYGLNGVLAQQYFASSQGSMIQNVYALGLGLPIPLHTRGEGVIWLPERSYVRAGAEGFVTDVLAEPHGVVHTGEPLIRTRDAPIEARVQALEAERQELRLRVQALSQENRVRTEIAQERLADTEAALARAREQASEVLIRSPTTGVFVIANVPSVVIVPMPALS